MLLTQHLWYSLFLNSVHVTIRVAGLHVDRIVDATCIITYIAGARIPASQLTHTRINNTCTILDIRICLECSFVRYAYMYDTRMIRV